MTTQLRAIVNRISKLIEEAAEEVVQDRVQRMLREFPGLRPARRSTGKKSRPARANAATRKYTMSPKAREQRKQQGRYNSAINGLPAKAKKAVRAARAEDGYAAAIALAAKLRPNGVRAEA